MKWEVEKTIHILQIMLIRLQPVWTGMHFSTDFFHLQ